MNPPFSSQLFGFAVSVAAGVVLGAFYDVFRIWRTFFHTEKRAVFFQDVFYMVAVAFLTFLLALAVSFGEIRFYLLGGEAAGWFAYYFTVGQVTDRVFRFISRLLYRWLLRPLKRAARRCARCFGGKFRAIGNFAVKIAGNAKKCLKRRVIIVYNLGNRLPLRGKVKRKAKKGVLYNHESHQRPKTE